MSYALNLRNDDRILSATKPQYAPDSPVVETLPSGDITDYKYINGEYVFDPIPKPPIFDDNDVLPESDDSWDEMAKAVQNGVDSV